jgi:hypothetical protein
VPTKKYEIDFGGNVLAGLEISNNEPTVIGAMNGWEMGLAKLILLLPKSKAMFAKRFS